MHSGTPKSILIVDDDESIRVTLNDFLETEGYEVFTAENGLQALEMLNTRLPSLIVLDMKMPIMNGWQFAAELFSRYDRKIPVVIMTAAPNAAVRAKEVNAVGWVGKPFQLEDLLEIIQQLTKPESDALF